MDESTLKSSPKSVKTVHSYLELQVLSSGHPERRLAFFSERMSFQEHAPGMLSPETKWEMEWGEDGVHLLHPEEQPIPLQVGQSVKVEDAFITLLDLRNPPTAHLISQDGLSWQLFFQRYNVGRRGRRLNHVELNDPTVSRQQATLVPYQPEGFELLCESGSSPTTVNEKTLEPGEQVRLQNGDMVQFGNLVFRYLNHQEDDRNLQLSLRTLGTFELKLNGQTLKNELPSAKTRWLVALLASRWGEPVSVEWIIGQFWPKASTSRARKNLGVAIKQLRETLNLDQEEFIHILDRSRTHLKLKASCLGTHDFQDLKALVSSGKALSSEATLDRLLALNQGPFLPDCYEDWAIIEKDNLKKEIVDSLKATVSYFGGLGNLATARRALQEIAKQSPELQEPVAVFMEAALKAAAPEQASAVFEELKARLEADQLEPEVDLLKLYYRAQSGI